MNNEQLKLFFDERVNRYNNTAFIPHDPICIPHRYTNIQDIEIAGFFAATFAWGNRTSIINSCTRLLAMMDNAPYDFVMNYKEHDLKKLLGFVHRTFNATDLLHFMAVLKHHYRDCQQLSLESAISRWMTCNDTDTENGLNGFYHYFFDSGLFEDYPQRTVKHVAAPYKKSACKRLNMFLRWMVRTDKQGVDFGIWKQIKPAQLVCPLDVHVARVARHFQLVSRTQNDWATAVELTRRLKQMDATDPVKYDFALFGLGVIERF